MRIAYHSVSPLVKSGYGRCTAELAYRLADDFEVDIYAYYGLLRSVIEIDLNGPHGPRKVRVIGNLQQDLWHHVLEKRAREYDLVITHSDSWAMPEKVRRAGGRWVAWVIGDHDPVPWGLRRFIEAENVVKVVPMTHWFKRVLEKARDVPKRKIADPIYHGIDLSFWHPVDECPIELPRGTEFFIATVAANYGPRENIPIMLEAYAIFLKENDVNAYYYVHAEPVREFGFNLIHVCEQLEEIYEVRLAGRVGFKMMDWEYPDEFMRALYSAADVHLLVPLGGSLEIPILEAAACIPKGEIILCNHHPVAVEKVVAGHKVLGISGRFQRVLRKHRRYYKDEVVEIKATGLLPIRLTKEHPVLVAKVERKNPVQMKNKMLYRNCPTGERVWKRADEIEVGDYLVFPKLNYSADKAGGIEIYCGVLRNTTHLDLNNLEKFGRKQARWKKIKVNADLMELFGRYVADGWVSGHSVELCFGKDEAEDFERFVNIAERAFGYKPLRRETETTLRFSINSPIIARKFAQLFGSCAEEKRIPPFVFRKPYILRFLRGYFGGDGTVNRRGDIQATTVSRTLALQLQQLLSRLNIFAPIQEIKQPSRSIIQGRMVNQHETIYRITIPSGMAKRLKAGGFDFRIKGKTPGGRHHKSSVVETDDAFLVPVTEVRKYPYKGWVYNMTTEDGTFQISNVVVHNCGTPSITSEFSGPGELVGYGERGLCVPAKVPVWMNRTSSRQFAVDPRDIAEALRIYLENPELRRQHAEKMRKWIEENATWDKVASQWYELIISLRR